MPVVRVNRRVFLKGAGAVIALPFFESAIGTAEVRRQPTRVCFMYVPNGMSMSHWRPPRVGALSSNGLPPILRPLVEHLEYVTVMSGLDNKACERAGPETLGEHARSIAAFLSAVYPERDLRAGPSIDYVLAERLGAGSTPLLNLTTEYAEDQHDEAYSEVFNYSLSWKDARSPIPPIDSPRLALARLCGDARTPGELESELDARRVRRQSVLDGVLESGRSLQTTLNAADRRTLEEYFESLRSVEQRIDAAPANQAVCRDATAFEVEPSSFDERLTLLMDLLHLALQSHSTRVATLLLGAERSERDFGFLTDRVGFDMSGGHHSTSHHKWKPELIRKYVEINTYHARHLARFLKKLRDTTEGDRNLLDSTFIVYGSSMADGNSHQHYNVPLLVAGKGNGLIDPGKEGFHVDYGGRPVSNLYVTLLQKLAIVDIDGNPYTSFGDSGGPLRLPGGV